MSYPKDAIYDVFSAISGDASVIWGYQNAASPKKPYIALSFGNSDPTDFPMTGEIDEDGNRQVARNVTSQLRVTYYGAESYMRLLDLATRLGFTTTADRCMGLNIAIGRLISLNYVPMAVDKAQFEDRSVLEVEVGWVNELQDSPGRIEQVVIAGSTTEGTDLSMGAPGATPFCAGVVSSP